MSTPLTEPSRWHYRRSLASRVTLLSTIAVALAVAFVALGAYVTVRMQLQSTLDESLLERAAQAADAGVLANTIRSGQDVPSGVLGAADVRMIFLELGHPAQSADQVPALDLGGPEV